jgi:hypothetical protein
MAPDRTEAHGMRRSRRVDWLLIATLLALFPALLAGGFDVFGLPLHGWSSAS